ncbi:putative membrane protein [Salmonella enterica subsp. enterica serovar Paratyphi A]|nr:putative membrane protein [Salmonella enterica subsp. enterica serovar Paratyphi A]CDV66186.1 putative membrane protein [Salmonella enterica subsp. enterica serovar Paratyphi A]
MDSLNDDKINRHSSDLEVESEEKQSGKEIEVDEDRLPSRAMAIHEHIRQDGEKEMERDAMALLWSAIAAGLSMGTSLLAKGIFHVQLEGVPGGFLLENLGYTFDFIIVIMARQQLFTENTVTAVLPVMQNPTLSNVGLLMRLWGVVLLGNLIGTGVAAWAFEYMPIFDEETRDAFVKIGMEVMKNSPTEMFANAIISGWIIATMVWMFPAAGGAKIVVIILMTWLIALGDTTHIVVGSVEILYLVFNGTLPWSDFFWPFALPTLAGNICGGTFIFALMSHAQIRNDMSNKRKEEARLRGERLERERKKAEKSGKTALSGDGLTSQAALHLLRRIKNAILAPRCPLS